MRLGNIIRNAFIAPLIRDTSYNLVKSGLVGSSQRFLNSSSNSSAYQGDGRTTVKLLTDEDPHLNLVSTYSGHGFRLANNLFIHGSILLFPTHVYSWNVRRGEDITPESLLVLDLIVPKVKIVVIGYGSRDEPYDASLPLHLKKRGISCELLPTPNAVTTFNYLVHDSVHVCGAFVPVKGEVNMTKRDFTALHEFEYAHGRDYIPIEDRSPSLEEQAAEIDESMNRDKGKKTFDE